MDFKKFIIVVALALGFANATSATERLLKCSGIPLLKFEDKFLLPDKVLKRQNGMWQHFCDEEGDTSFSIGDYSARCESLTKFTLRRRRLPNEIREYQKACFDWATEQEALGIVPYVSPFIYEDDYGWETWKPDINFESCKRSLKATSNQPQPWIIDQTIFGECKRLRQYDFILKSITVTLKCSPIPKGFSPADLYWPKTGIGTFPCREE